MQREEEARQLEQELETEYQWYCTQAIDRYVAALDPQEVAAMREVRRKENEGKYQNQWLVDDFTERETKREFGKRVTLMTFEEFKITRANPADVSLKPVSEVVSSTTAS